MPEVITKEQYEVEWGHSRNILVNPEVDSHGVPFVLCVKYAQDKDSNGNVDRAIVLDNDIMPYLRGAVKRYLRQSVKADKFQKGNRVKATYHTVNPDVCIKWGEAGVVEETTNGRIDKKTGVIIPAIIGVRFDSHPNTIVPCKMNHLKRA